MKVMTFNLRFENDRDGPNAWPLRRRLVADLIKRYEPAILGTQEGRCSQLVYLGDRLPKYHLHAPHRTLDETCQYPTLYFHREHFAVHEGGEFWLSKTPQTHRSKDWDSAFPRMMSYAKIMAFDTNTVFWAAVTHLDHMGTEARYEQAKIIADWASERSEPIILMGDFNDEPGSQVHRLLTSDQTGLKDSWQILGRKEGRQSATHHGFTGTPQKTRMDWVLVSREFDVTEAEIISDHREDQYPSDHFPYMVLLNFAA